MGRKRYFCPVCHSEKPSPAGLCGRCGYEERQTPRHARSAPRGTRPAPSPAEPIGTATRSLLDTLTAWSGSCLDSLREKGTERLVGEKLLNYIGMVLLVLGGAFFLKYTADMMGAHGKVAVSILSGFSLIGLGEYLRRDRRFELFSVPVIGGGWILVYYAVYAAHYIDATRIISFRPLEFFLLCATAGGMIAHSLRVRSRLLTAFAFGAAYFVFAVTDFGTQTLTVCGILAIAGAYLVRPLGHPELAAVNLAGFYLNYLPVFRGVLMTHVAGPTPAAEFWYGLAVVTLVHAVYVWRTPVKDASGAPRKELDAGLSFSAILYAAFAYAQLSVYEPAHPAAALLGLSAVLGVLSSLRGESQERTALSSVQGLLAATITALALLRLGTLYEQFWGFALAASVFGSAGLWLRRESFEKYGLAMAAAAALLYLAHLPAIEGVKLPVGAALAYLGFAGYALAAAGRRAGRTSTWVSGCWLYSGLFFLLLALWTWLEPPAFAVAAIMLAVGIEYAAASLRSPVLFQQALLVELFVGCYSFVIDYGLNLPVAGAVTSRGLVAGSLTASYAFLIFGMKTPEGSFLGFAYREWRRALVALMLAVASFGVYHEFGPRMRLPIWGISALLLLALGRRRGRFGEDLRAHGYLLTLGTAAEGILSYLVYPASLLRPIGPRETAIFAGSSLLLLWPLLWPAWGETDAERTEESAAAHLFSILSATLLTLFIAKESVGTHITLRWTLVGVSYLISGLLLRRQALRLPGLALLGLCVMKALFMDLTGLALPYRVLSYTVLGGLLVVSSYIYVRITQWEDADAA
ncbi:MAG: DUF2339 domain-containing protein [Elusimicrobiota bacterium]